jgi:hypothetical protein
MANKKRLAKPREQQPAELPNEGPKNRLLMLQTLLAAPIIQGEEDGTEGSLSRLQAMAKEGSGELYLSLKPKDAAAQMRAALTVGVTTATMDCLAEAARMKAFPAVRDMALKQAFSGARVAADLLETLERHQRQDPKAVNVGRVNVEAGGQAIVGHVESRGDPRASTTDTSPTLKPTDTDEAEE